MKIVRVPLRISFFGGRTDIPSFYENYGGGCSLGTSISKYVYVAFEPREDSVVEIHKFIPPWANLKQLRISGSSISSQLS